MQHPRHRLLRSPRQSLNSGMLTGVATHGRGVYSPTACVRILFCCDLLLQRLREGATQEQRADVACRYRPKFGHSQRTPLAIWYFESIVTLPRKMVWT